MARIEQRPCRLHILLGTTAPSLNVRAIYPPASSASCLINARTLPLPSLVDLPVAWHQFLILSLVSYSLLFISISHQLLLALTEADDQSNFATYAKSIIKGYIQMCPLYSQCTVYYYPTEISPKALGYSQLTVPSHNTEYANIAF